MVMLTLASIMGLSLRGLYHRLKNSRLWARLFNLKPGNVPHLATLARRKNDSDVKRLRDRLYKKKVVGVGEHMTVLDCAGLCGARIMANSFTQNRLILFRELLQQGVIMV
ncbi:MAG: hypothetical protein IBX64_02135 [Actinobacteria bacterium]|nr:hypothetical protein [Actinomycetota bacterium]